jgi:hypothetical protein
VKAKRAFVLRITLNGSKPPIWRRVAVPSGILLGELHDVIQIAMGWTDSHLHQFVLRDKSLKPSLQEMARRFQQDAWDETFLDRMGGRRVFVTKVTPWGDPTEMDGEDEDAVTLAEVCPKVKSKLIYEYDFGDGWEHTIEVQKITEPETDAAYPVCLAGKKACPPEDCGGVWGYYEMLEALADRNHERHEEILEWLGGGFDPDAFDLEETNARLAKWRGSGSE